MHNRQSHQQTTMQVDDLKIFPIERKVIEDIIRQLHKKSGQESLLTTAHGKVLE